MFEAGLGVSHDAYARDDLALGDPLSPLVGNLRCGHFMDTAKHSGCRDMFFSHKQHQGVFSRDYPDGTWHDIDYHSQFPEFLGLAIFSSGFFRSTHVLRCILVDLPCSLS